jgi:predicted acylesterase/phospholipase RssA
MSMHYGKAAKEELSRRLGPPPGPDGSYPVSGATVPPLTTVTLPSGFATQHVPNSIWTDAEPVPVLRDQAAYQLGEIDLIHKSPFDLLSGQLTADELNSYRRRSADVTMRGGTTSGVVYPLAICEIARSFRLRNVGGASAGAIAASFAAAAEVGRMATDEAGTPKPAAPTDEQLRSGHVRSGFPGVADGVAWLAQIDESGPEQYRVARLFLPAARARPLFRLAVAAMRGRHWAYPMLAVGAFGWLSKVLVWLALAAAVWAVAQAGTGSDNLSGHLLDGLAAVAGLAGLSLTIIGLLLLLSPLFSRKRHRPVELSEPVGGPVLPRSRGWTSALLVLTGAVLLVLALWPLGLHWPTLLVVWCLLLLALLIIFAVSVGRLLQSAKQSGFGLLPGSTPPPRTASLWDRVAGMPTQASDRPLVPWLSQTMSELAGLGPDQVLRFGHLWYGRDYRPGSPPPDVRQVADDPTRRRVNLELMASELVEGHAYRFPLSRGELLTRQEGGVLYFRVEDLGGRGQEIMPPDVIAAMTTGEPIVARDLDTGADLTLYPLPEPWDLPVVFAVRLSMALPALFHAVPLYRQIHPILVRDDLGRVVTRDGQPLYYPPQDPAARWVQQLWFSDGGITSNFPIHFFDSPLPLWPTFGINLGDHPPGFAHQDVWLPQDWQGGAPLAPPMSPGFGGFYGAVVDTARAWRDNTQTRMPGYRGRVAWVRQRSNEGGTNLFMTSETIAGLALRGAFAGARLRQRFITDPYWRRHQWLRLRTTMDDLEGLRNAVEVALGDRSYAELAGVDTGPVTLNEIINQFTLGDPDTTPDGTGIDLWYEPPQPDQAFWTGLSTFLVTLAGLHPAPSLRNGPPQPAPDLRQVPPV